MGKTGYHVIDADGHVRESSEDLVTHIDPGYRDRLQRILQWAGKVASRGIGQHPSVGIPYNYMAQGYDRTGRRLLGTWDVGDNLDPSTTVIGGPAGGLHPNVRKGGGRDPYETREDITGLGIDRAVWFPTTTTSVMAVGDPRFEAALCTAYNRWIADFCAPYPNDFKAVAVVPHLDLDLGVREIQRVAKEGWCVGVSTCATVGDKLPDHPVFHPMYQALQDADLALCIHSGTDRPPYPPGRADLSDNYFLLHMSGHPWQQMRAMAALVGGGVYEASRASASCTSSRAAVGSPTGWSAWTATPRLWLTASRN